MTTEGTRDMYDWAEDAEERFMENLDDVPFVEPLPIDDEPLAETVQHTVADGVVMVDPHSLRPHPRNREVYGDQAPPSDLLDSIRNGWSRTSILEALPDGTLISGHLRRFAAVQLHISAVPVLYRSDLTDDEAAQVEELLSQNAGRVKSRETICREWRLGFATFKSDVGSVSGEKSRDVVGKRFGVSGVTLEHGIAVVNALDGKGLDVETKDKVRTALAQRGVEPAWKILRKSQQPQSEAQDEAEGTQDESPVTLAISPAKRHKALLDVLSAVDDRLPAFSDIEALVKAIPQESLDDTLAAVQNVVILLGNIEGEIRDRLDSRKRAARRKKGS